MKCGLNADYFISLVRMRIKSAIADFYGSNVSSAIIKTIEVKDSEEVQSSPQPGGSQMPGSSALSSPAPESKVLKAIKGRVLTPGKQRPKVVKGSPVLAKKKLSVGGSRVGNPSGFEGSCPLCRKKFMDAMLLETHASDCDGQVEQVTHFVFLLIVLYIFRAMIHHSLCRRQGLQLLVVGLAWLNLLGGSPRSQVMTVMISFVGI